MGEWSRRSILAAVAGASGSTAALAIGDSSNDEGNLYGGTMALSQEYNVSGDLWIGPDSAKSNVSADSGRIYLASDTQVEYYGDSGNWEPMGVGSSSNPVPNVDSQTVTTEESVSKRAAVTERNKSVSGSLTRTYQGAAVSDGGTHYALHYDGSDYVLYTASDPTADSFSERYRWSGLSQSNKREIHITASGSILVGLDGTLYRSTDNGQSFSSVLDLGGATHIWTFTENSSGSILASEDNTRVIHQSTDDGKTWSTFADGTDFGNFPSHVHRVRYHPANDYIIVTGGDSASTKGFYRSTDGGSTWDFYPIEGGDLQCVAIGLHPTDGSTYFLGSDTQSPPDGPILKVNDDGTNVSMRRVVEMNTDALTNTAYGTFGILTFEDPNNVDESYYLATSITQEPSLVWASNNANGNGWSVVGEIGTDTVYGETRAQGPYENVHEIGQTDAIVNGDTWVRVDPTKQRLYGRQARATVDERDLIDNIRISQNPTGGNQYPHFDFSLPSGETTAMLESQSGTGKVISLDHENDRWRWTVDGSRVMELVDPSFTDLYARLRLRNSSQKIAWMNAENLSGKTGNNDGEVRMDDGTNTAARMTPCVWDNDNNVWRPVNDPSAGSFS